VLVLLVDDLRVEIIPALLYVHNNPIHILNIVVAERVRPESEAIDPEIRDFVYDKVLGYPQTGF
jgi:hypothetical protein